MQAERRVRDEWLALRCQSGEPGAFEALIAEFEKPLFAYLYQIVRREEQALELLQEIWIRALKSFRKLHDPASVRAWLYKLAHGIAIDHVRRERSRSRVEEQFAGSARTSIPPDVSSISGGELYSALAELPAERRAALTLHFLEDFSIAETASIAGCPEGTIKSRIHYAKAQLKQLLLKGHHGTR